MSRFRPGALLADAAMRGARYVEALDTRHVYPRSEDIDRLENALRMELPDAPANPADVLSFVDEYGSPATVACAGGRYFGFVTGGAMLTTVATSWLASAWDQNAFSFVSSPAAALFEEAALRWIKDIIDITPDAEGTLVTGATMANFTGLASARSEVLRRAGWDVDSRGLIGAPAVTVVVGEEVHGTVLKVLGMLGLGRDNVTRVAVDSQGRMRPDRIPGIDGPTILCVQAGNVNSGAFDPADEIIPAARAQGAWVHVDGAFGLWARACPSHSHRASGYEAADSWAMDAHKWLNVPYDCGIALVRSREAMHRAMSIAGSYLMLGERRDPIDVTPDASRRARGLDVWVALKSLGRSGLSNLIERNCRQARTLAEGLREAGVEVLNDVVLNQVVVAFDDDERTARVIAAVQESGECWFGATMWRGRHAARISVSSWATSDADIDLTLHAILSARDRI
jgi:glutamate/tyrosine decarboxylase-like PLP-dependent enzyme